MQSKPKTPRNWTYITTTGIVYLFMLGAGAVSFTHIVELFHRLGCGWEAYTAPVFIDGFAVLGKLGTSTKFAESTRKTGLKLMVIAGLVSLIANVKVGENRGQQLYGALIVVGFMVAEWYAGKLCPAPTARKLDPAVAKARATKAAQTRAAKKATNVEPTPTPEPVVQPAPVHVVNPIRPRTGAFGLPRQPLGKQVKVLSKQAA